MCEDRKSIKISVRNLVEFILREGDIDTRKSKRLPDAMQEGNRIHRKIQKSMPASYQAEVPLNIKIETEEYDIIVEGRADGILIDDIVTVDEIKGIYMDLFHLKQPFNIHLAQAKCYAYIYSFQNNLSEINITMTYCSLDTEEIKRFPFHFSFMELSEWFTYVMKQYRKWADFQLKWNERRNASIKTLEFPYPYREGQKDLAAGVYRTIYHGKKLFIQAGTGVGKTISTIFPAIKAIGEGYGDKIFYLTAKTVTANVALDTYDLLRERGLLWKSVHLTAKEKICFCDRAECNPEFCIYAKGHYNRINDAVYALLTENDSFTRESLVLYAKKHEVCPFEMSLDITLWADCVIADYNYVFDPNVQLKRFFGENNKGNYLFLIDEAHNLVDRAREMYSAEIIKEEFLSLKKIMQQYNRKIVKHLNTCNKILIEMKKDCKEYLVVGQIDRLYMKLLSLYEDIEKYLNDEDTEAVNSIKNALLNFYFKVSLFILMYESRDNHSLIYMEVLKNSEFKLKLFCVNPSQKITDCLMKGRSAVFFSATLLPIAYYYQLLGGNDEDYRMYAQAPFDNDKRCLLLANDVSSKYTRRNATEYEKIALYIKKAVKVKKGNYMLFFPSYKYMHDIYEIYRCKYQDICEECIIQDNSMTEQQREEFLSRYIKNAEMDNSQTLIGFCVMGGIFSEGIDLKQRQLIGTIIVGTGVPQISNERKILSEYFIKERLNGFDYAYRYPGMNKILQSAGRVIRTEQDVGVILLLDERFLEISNLSLFPKEWETYDVCSLSTVVEKLDRFWKARNSLD